MKKLIREPLVHFLLLGAALFAASNLLSQPGTGRPDEIFVTQGQIEHLATAFARTWQRPPSEKELEGLLRDYVREEVYYREAMAMGLDRDDTIIRRRLHQKLEFLSNDIIAHVEPSDVDLRAYLDEHALAFRVDEHVSFRHVYLNPDRHGANLMRDAEQILATLTRAGAEADISQYGDPFLLEQSFEPTSARDIAKDFGQPFAAALEKLPAGQWQGPVESGYGLHLVFVSARTEGRTPALEEVREAVRREWINAKRLEANAKFYEDLLQRYIITIAKPKQEASEAKGPGSTVRP